MLKVLHVFSATHRGGAETMIMNILRETNHKEFQYDFISHAPGKSDYDDEIISYGGKVINQKSLGSVGFIRYVRNLRNTMIKEGPYKVVHCHTNLQASAVLLAAKLAKVDIRIAHSHNTSWSSSTSIKNKVWTVFSKLTIKKIATNYIACGKDAGLAMFGRKKMSEGKVEIIQNGIDAKSFIKASNDEEAKRKKLIELDLDKDSFIIGHVGRYHFQKNHKFILLIAKKLKEKKLNCKILLVGTGEDKEEVQTLIQKDGLEDIILELGVRSDIPELMSIFDLFILPSHYEGLPLVLVEAQAAKRRCLVSNRVTTETDLGLSLIDFMDIGSKASLWVNRIEDLSKEENTLLDDSIVMKRINDRGYNSKKNVGKLSLIYQKGNYKEL